MLRLVSLLVVAALSVGCAASGEPDFDSSNEALAAQTFTAAACKTPTVSTKSATDSSGAAIAGSAITSLSGCIVGKTGETGAAVSARLVTLLGDTTRISHVNGTDGNPVFAKFTPGAQSGTLATGLVQDVDVTLDMFGSPSSTLRVTRKLSANGVYSLHITNLTPFKASVAFIPVTAIDAGRLTLDVQSTPEENGLSIAGKGSVELDIQRDQAAGAAQIVADLFTWLTTELSS